MPRQARIDIPGLLQHVIVRGVARTDIFVDDEDREDFVQRLGHLLAETKTLCFAWVLLNNHVHLLLTPTEQPLARFMRRLLTGYAVVFNLRHKRSGHLFQNRYKSIVCDTDAYLLELVRYIHLNPLRAGIVATLDDLSEYRWCGHQQLLGKSEHQLIQKDELLSLFSKQRKTAVAHYLQFLAAGLPHDKRLRLSSGGRRISQILDTTLQDDALYDERILGGGIFVEQVLSAAQIDIEAELTLDELIARVAVHCGVVEEDLVWPCRQPEIVRAKALICYLATRRCHISGIDVAKRLGYSNSAVSHATKRGQELLKKDKKLQETLK
ncbi:MAG: transposase [Deltaproteobacteria bacterium]|jgi:REP element-mobilizing transposase RayT|nr:transposase [Deltaproteobacteria bacterium]